MIVVLGLADVKKSVLLIAGGIGIVGLGVAMLAGVLEDHVRIACATAGLARPPAGAEILHAGGWSSGFSSQSCFAFKATPAEIEAWIQDSPSLRDSTPDVLTEDHRLVSFDSAAEATAWQEAHPEIMAFGLLNGPRYVREYKEMGTLAPSSEMRYCVWPPGGVSWFKPNITCGRIFEVPVSFCSVIIDDANDVVWVAASDG